MISDRKFLPLIFLLSGLLLSAINFQSISFFLTLSVMPGWDGTAHQAIGELYSKNIFPQCWGWIPQWYLGMPFPQFYPPAFYFLIAIFSHLLFFISYNDIFRAFVFITLFLIPGSLAWCAYRLTRDRQLALLTAFLSILFLSIEKRCLME